MSASDDVLEWIRPALEEMKQDYSADPAKPWEERRESFLQQLGLRDASQHPTVQQLMERLDETPEDERNRVLGSDQLDAMATELAQQDAAGQQEGGQQSGGQSGGQQSGYDEHAWQAFLAENGPRWDGTDASWDQFRQWFAYYAGQQGLGTPATALLDYLATQPAAERITTFAQYGVTIPAQQAATGANGAAGYDEQAWQAFLAENGPRWDGTDASWDQFRQWFAYYAGQQGLGTPATALLDYLATQPAAERISTFAQYGVAIAPSREAAQPAAAELSDEEIESLVGGVPAEQGGQEAAQAAGDEDSDEDLGALAEDPLDPGSGDMSEEERIRVMSEALDGLDLS